MTAAVAAPIVAGAVAATILSPRQAVRTIAPPFAMPPIQVLDFSASESFSIERYGARPADQAGTTQALRCAIAAAHGAGGGTVLVPPGIWETGPIHLRSNVNLQISHGATLLFSPRPADYLPAVATSVEGLECLNYSPLIYAFDCENIAITGQGKLVARIDVWRTWSVETGRHSAALKALYELARTRRPVSDRDMTGAGANLRPQFIHLNRCRNVLIEGVAIENSPFWVIHPFLCRNVVIRGVQVVAHGRNNDGIDVEMSQNVLIEHCTLDQGDDAIAIKAGREYDGWRLATPSRNIVARDCVIRNGHQLLAIGSELSGGVENVWMDRCRIDQRGASTKKAVGNLLYIKTNERRGGFVRNIHLTNVIASELAGGVLCIDTDVLYQWRALMPTDARRLTAIEHVRVAEVSVDRAAYDLWIKGDAGLPVRDVGLKHVTVRKTAGPTRIDNATGISNLV